LASHIDGSINEKTREAINKYQEQSGLSLTGSLDQATMRRLREDAGTAGSSTPPGGADRPTGLMTNPHPELLGGSRPGGPRIASPEMFPEAEMVPHLICSRPMFIGGANDEADQHGGA
jgi:putative peptidoglycan binding protein